MSIYKVRYQFLDLKKKKRRGYEMVNFSDPEKAYYCIYECNKCNFSDLEKAYYYTYDKYNKVYKNFEITSISIIDDKDL